MTNIEKKGYNPVAIRIYDKEKKVILEDEVLCAYDTRNSAIVSIGKECRSYLQDNYVAVVNPLKWGVVADYEIFRKVLAYYIKKLLGPFGQKVKVAVCVPAKLTEVEKTAFIEAFMTYVRKPFCLAEKSMEQLLIEGMDTVVSGMNYYIEFVSEYYESEYFD